MKKYLTLGLLVSGLVLGGCSDREVVEDTTKIDNVEDVTDIEITDLLIEDDEQREPEEVKETDSEEKEEEKKEAEQKAKEEEEKGKEAKLKEKEEKKREREAKEEADRIENERQKEAEVNTVLTMMRENFGDGADVEFSEELNVFKVIPKDESFSYEVYKAMSGDPQHLEVWNRLVDSQVEFSESIKGLIGEGYGLAMINPMNEDNTLLLCMDGVMLYDGVAGGN